MKKEELIALGLDEEMAKKVAEASAEELKTYVPKAKFEETSSEKKQLELDIKERDKQLEALKNSSDDVEGMKKQIETLQTENKTSKEKYEAEMKDLKLVTAIKLSLAGKVHDEELAASLFKKEQLVLGDDGKVVGLEEQLKELQESKAFLFKTADNTNGKKQDYEPKKGEQNTNSLAKAIAEGFNKEETSNPYEKAWA